MYADIDKETISNFNEVERAIYEKGEKIIESCVTVEQLDTALKFSELASEKYFDVGNTLRNLIENRKIQIEGVDSEIIVTYKTINPDGTEYEES